MLALYRDGRHADALAAYRDGCEALDEIGLQPGPELRQLEQAILRHDPSLQAPHAPTAPAARPPGRLPGAHARRRSRGFAGAAACSCGRPAQGRDGPVR